MSIHDVRVVEKHGGEVGEFCGGGGGVNPYAMIRHATSRDLDRAHQPVGDAAKAPRV